MATLEAVEEVHETVTILAEQAHLDKATMGVAQIAIGLISEAVAVAPLQLVVVDTVPEAQEHLLI